MKYLTLLCLPLLLVACGKDKDQDSTGSEPNPLAFDVEAYGPYNTGFRSWPVTYDVLGEPRTITVNAWYPTNDEAGAEVKYAGIQEDPLAYGGAEVALPLYEGGYPLMVHSHGHKGFGGTSSEMMRFFASHGWVSVAPDHTDNLLFDDDANEVAWFDALRPLDVIQTVDSVAALPDSDPLGSVVTDRYALSGHSRGVTTVWSLIGAPYNPADTSDYCDGCDAAQLALFEGSNLADPRAVAAIPMAGTFSESTFGSTGFAGVTVPILSMTGTNDGAQRHQDQWNLISGIDFAWLDLEGGCHQTFALGTCETLDPVEGFWMVDTYALAMSRVHLLGDTDKTTTGLLDGSIDLDPRARLLIK